jgi:hypothetical protein
MADLSVFTRIETTNEERAAIFEDFGADFGRFAV